MRNGLLIKPKWLPALQGNTVLPSQQPCSCFPARRAQITLLLLSKTAVCVCVCVCSSPILFLNFSSSPSVNTYVCGKESKHTHTVHVIPAACGEQRGNTNSSSQKRSLLRRHCSWTIVYHLRWDSTCFLGHAHSLTHTHTHTQTHTHCSSKYCWCWMEAKTKVSLLSISSRAAVALCVFVCTWVFMRWVTGSRVTAHSGSRVDPSTFHRK